RRHSPTPPPNPLPEAERGSKNRGSPLPASGRGAGGEGSHRDPLTWLLDTVLGWFFRLFNWLFGGGTAGYGWGVGRRLRGSALVLLVYAGLLMLTGWVFHKAPTGFVPAQDQGRIICNIQLPDSASRQRTDEAVAQIAEIARRTKGVAHTITVSGIA